MPTTSFYIAGDIETLSDMDLPPLVKVDGLRSIANRGLGNRGNFSQDQLYSWTTSTSSFTETQRRNFNILVIVVSAVSLSVSCFAFYWFMRMKRSFRHQYVYYD